MRCLLVNSGHALKEMTTFRIQSSGYAKLCYNRHFREWNFSHPTSPLEAESSLKLKSVWPRGNQKKAGVSMVLTSEGEYKRGAESVWTLSILCGGAEQVRAKEQKCAVELSLEKQCHRETFGKRVPFPTHSSVCHSDGCCLPNSVSKM